MQFNIKDEYTKSDIESVIDILESELIGLKPVKNRIREIAALLLIDKLRKTDIHNRKNLIRIFNSKISLKPNLDFQNYILIALLN